MDACEQNAGPVLGYQAGQNSSLNAALQNKNTYATSDACFSSTPEAVLTAPPYLQGMNSTYNNSMVSNLPIQHSSSVNTQIPPSTEYTSINPPESVTKMTGLHHETQQLMDTIPVNNNNCLPPTNGLVLLCNLRTVQY